jgi:hypothetical protein
VAGGESDHDLDLLGHHLGDRLLLAVQAEPGRRSLKRVGCSFIATLEGHAEATRGELMLTPGHPVYEFTA